jgi:hypothetical protein
MLVRDWCSFWSPKIFIKKRKPTKHFRSNSLGFLICWMLLSVRELFRLFFGSLEVRWRQLSWASIAVRENQTAAFRPGLLQMIPLWFSQISSKIRKFPGHKLYLSSPLQNANFASSFCGLFESGSASVNWCLMDEITKRIAAPKFQIIEKKITKIFRLEQKRGKWPQKLVLCFFKRVEMKKLHYQK